MNADVTPMSDWLEQAWLKRYLDRRLTSEETAWFEAYALDRPELLAAIEQDNTLRDALAARRPQRADERSWNAGARRVALRGIPLRLAAALLLALFVGFLLPRPDPGDNGALVASPPRVVFDTLRGELAAPVHYGGDPDSPLVLVDIGVPPDAADARVLLDGEARPLVVSSDGFVSFLLPAHMAGADGTARIEYTSAGARQAIDVPLHAVLPGQAD